MATPLGLALGLQRLPPARPVETSALLDKAFRSCKRPDSHEIRVLSHSFNQFTFAPLCILLQATTTSRRKYLCVRVCQSLSKKLDWEERRVARWFRRRRALRHASKLTKFTESFWKFAFYLAIWFFGFFVLWDVCFKSQFLIVDYIGHHNLISLSSFSTECRKAASKLVSLCPKRSHFFLSDKYSN